MQRRDGSLHGVRSRRTATQRRLHQLRPFPNLLPSPQTAILLLQQNQLPFSSQSRIAPRIVEQHQSQQRPRLPLPRQQFAQHPPQADRLRAHLPPDQRIPAARKVPFVENQVDDQQDHIQPVAQVFL